VFVNLRFQNLMVEVLKKRALSFLFADLYVQAEMESRGELRKSEET